MPDPKEDLLQIGSVFRTTGQGHKVNADPDSRDAVGNEEATRDPIFLLQHRRIVGMDTINGIPESDFYHDGDCLWVDADQFTKEEVAKAKADDEFRERDEDFDNDAIRVDDGTLIERGWAIISWEVESVWFRRDEAEDYARGQRHNLGELGKSCRVYCVCAEGRLASILKVVHNKEIEEYLHSQSFRMDYAAHRKAMETMIGGPGA